jgi:hypothetical protein
MATMLSEARFIESSTRDFGPALHARAPKFAVLAASTCARCEQLRQECTYEPKKKRSRPLSTSTTAVSPEPNKSEADNDSVPPTLLLPPPSNSTDVDAQSSQSPIRGPAEGGLTPETGPPSQSLDNHIPSPPETSTANPPAVDLVAFYRPRCPAQ